MEKEARTEDLQWALQSLTAIADKIDPTTGKPLVPATAFSHILAQIFEAMSGMPPPPPALDGRSPQAGGAIAGANDVAGMGGGG
jgi:hypothetical protein